MKAMKTSEKKGEVDGWMNGLMVSEVVSAHIAGIIASEELCRELHPRVFVYLFLSILLRKKIFFVKSAQRVEAE